MTAAASAPLNQSKLEGVEVTGAGCGARAPLPSAAFLTADAVEVTASEAVVTAKISHILILNLLRFISLPPVVDVPLRRS